MQNDTEHKSDGKKILIVIGILVLIFIVSSNFDSNYTDNTQETQVIKEIKSSSSHISQMIKENENSSSDISGTDTSKWQEFVSKTGSFKALFPTDPTCETKNQELFGYNVTLKLDSCMSIPTDTSLYFINIAKYPSKSDVANAKTVLMGSLAGTLGLFENSNLISSEFTKFVSYEAMDYLIEFKNEDIFLKGKNIIVGQNMYQLANMEERQNFSEKNYNKFINSFQFLSE